MINLLTYVISTLLTYFMGLASKRFGWNEELPIPVQNILIGLFVFGIVIVYTHLTGGELDFNNITTQIITALGGSGTATLIYDNLKDTKEKEK